MSSKFNPNAPITASKFMQDMVTFYNDYWHDPVNAVDYPFAFDQHHTNPNSERRKGWGQDPVKVKGLTETSVAQGQLIEREHLNTVAAQVNAGLYHIDNDYLFPNNSAYIGLEARPLSNNTKNLVTAAEVEQVRNTVVSVIDSQKFECADDNISTKWCRHKLIT